MPNDSQPYSRRQRWLALLARAPRDLLETATAALPPSLEYESLRPPQTGLVMVRGRAGGTGRRFNLGEMTVTRAAVRTADGTLGHGYVAGRDRQRAELVALFDALLQEGRHEELIRERLLDPVERRIAAHRASVGRKAAATRVDFFTMAREG